MLKKRVIHSSTPKIVFQFFKERNLRSEILHNVNEEELFFLFIWFNWPKNSVQLNKSMNMILRFPGCLHKLEACANDAHK